MKYGIWCIPSETWRGKFYVSAPGWMQTSVGDLQFDSEDAAAEAIHEHIANVAERTAGDAAVTYGGDEWARLRKQTMRYEVRPYPEPEEK